jgi:predicted transcriptional regulator
MEIQISNTAAARHLAASAGCSVEEYVNLLIKQASDLEAIREGLNDVKTGRVTPLAEFDKEFRNEMGFMPKKADE